jgi:hypothetical protein
MPDLKKRDAPGRPGPDFKLYREMNMAARAIDEKERTVELSFSSEAPVERWWGSEILCHDDGCCDMTRLKEMGILLFNHDRSIPLGPVMSAELDAKEHKGRAVVRFDEDEVSDWYFRKVLNGTLKGVSVGYRVNVWEVVEPNAKSTNGRFSGPCEVATKWTPFEISICSVPADATVGVGRSDDGDQPEPQSDNNAPDGSGDTTRAEGNAHNREDDNMPGVIEKNDAQPVQPAQPVVERQEDQERQAVELERKRVSDIMTVCREFNVDALPYIEDKSSVDAVRAAILDKLKKDKPPVDGAVRVVKDETDKFRDAASHALLLRAGLDLSKAGIKQPADGAEQLRGMGIRSMMEEYLRMNGEPNAARLEVVDLMKRVFTPDSQFASILDNTVNHSMMIGHAIAPVTYHRWTKKGSLKDFKLTPQYRMSEAGRPQLVGQNGELQRDEMTDEGVFSRLNTYGVTWGLTRQAIINDDLDVITTMPMQYAMAYFRQINGDVYSILNANPAIYDGVALFAAAHNNLAGAGALFGVNTLGLARAAMARQTGIRNQEALNITPRYAIFSPERITGAQMVISSPTDITLANANAANPFQGAIDVLTDAEVSAVTPWFLAADPNAHDTIQVNYLDGKEQPSIDSRAGFDILGMEWRLYGDYGVTVKDFRGLYMNPGA